MAMLSLMIPPSEKTKTLYTMTIVEVNRMLIRNACGFPSDKTTVFAINATIKTSEMIPCHENAPKTAIKTEKMPADR